MFVVRQVLRDLPDHVEAAVDRETLVQVEWPDRLDCRVLEASLDRQEELEFQVVVVKLGWREQEVQLDLLEKRV